MISKKTLTIAALGSVLALSAIAAIGITPASATSSEGQCWGDASSTLGQSGEMGTHASNPGDLDPSSPAREGLGNLKNDLGGGTWSGLLGALGAPC